ncbi:MAG: hypothetical protein JOZ02_20425 [Acidobacteria bacterium]|jgi:hypothetical protein|nr:hypothetical protein [Acidobacteriota bacterium]
MGEGDAMITQVPADQSATLPSALPPEQPKQPGRFSKIFGGIAAGALNIVAPGMGSVVGSFINRGGVDVTNMNEMLRQQQLMSMQMLAVQNRVQTQTQEFTTVSNLLKARHDGEMSAVHNFKS